MRQVLPQTSCIIAPLPLLLPCPHLPQAYLTVAPYVAAFPQYFEPLAWHLLRSKLRHWEKGLRELAAQAMAGGWAGGRMCGWAGGVRKHSTR